MATPTALARWLGLRLPLAGIAALLGIAGLTHSAHAGGLHHAALLVEHSSGRFLTRCVSFFEDQINGFELIERSGIEYQAQIFGSMGSAICQLDNEPSPVPSSCFGSGAYWQYDHRTPIGWAQSGVGASNWVLHDGDMDGWRYAPSAGPPPNVTFPSVCAAPATSAPAPTRGSGAPVASITSRTPSVTAVTSATMPTAPPPSPETMAPSLRPIPKAGLALTGPTTAGSSSSSSVATWLLLGFGSTLLIGLAGINLLRRGP